MATNKFSIEKIIPQHIDGETPEPVYAAPVWTEKGLTTKQTRTFGYPKPPAGWKYAIVSYMQLQHMTEGEIAVLAAAEEDTPE